jgi:hypothetical protein
MRVGRFRTTCKPETHVMHVNDVIATTRWHSLMMVRTVKRTPTTNEGL